MKFIIRIFFHGIKHHYQAIGHIYVSSFQDQHLNIAVMPVYGLIHDGQLRACPCALLGLIHGLRRLNAIRYLGFQLLATV
jgi:hypothetical protein